MKIKHLLIALLMMWVAACGSGIKEEVQFPDPRPGYVHDFSNVLSPNVISMVNNQLRLADKAGKTKMAVVTVPSLYGLDVADYTIQLGKKWGVGDKKSDNGIILLIATKERKVRLEVAYGNEGVIPDGVAKLILVNHVTPYLKKNDFNGGVQSGVSAVLSALDKKKE
jgi:uncharacterized protein